MKNTNIAINSITTADNGCTHITLTRSKNTPTNNTNYTSQGKRKASPCDPIREHKDILKIQEYFLNAGENPILKLRNNALFTLGISIGVRGGDLLKIKISDVLNPNGTIMNEMRIFESKTRKTIYPFINKAAQDAISSYLNALPSYSFDDMLFSKTSNRKEHITLNTLYVLMRNAQKALNLPYHLGTHSLRKTFAYWTIKLHPNNLETMINHSSMHTTLHYAGQTKDVIKPMYDDLSTIFSSETKFDKITQEAKTEKIYALISELISEE